MVKKPNFFIVGGHRSGTTSLYEYLKQHPDVFMSHEKEPTHFGKDLTKKQPCYYETIEQYLSLFNGTSNHIAIGDASVSYYVSLTAAKEIYDFNPDAKIIFSIRDPIDMIHSLYWFFKQTADENAKKFEDALDEYPERKRILREIGSNNRINGESTLYPLLIERLPKAIKEYQDLFGKENVMIIRFSDLETYPEKVYKKVTTLIGVDSDFVPDFTIYNKTHLLRNKGVAHLIKSLGNNLLPIRRIFFPKRLGIITFLEKLNYSHKKYPPMNEETRKALEETYEKPLSELRNILDQQAF